MADDPDRAGDTDGVSPWLRDDWSAEPAPLDRWETDRPADERTRGRGDDLGRFSGGGAGRPGDRERSTGGRIGDSAATSGDRSASNAGSDGDGSRRTGLAALGGLAVLALIGVGVWLVGNDDPSTSPSDDDVTSPLDTAATDSTPPSTVAPTTTAATATTAEPISEPGVLIGDGDTIDWTESTIQVPPHLAEMSVPTEVIVTTNDRRLHRIEFPSGRVRTFDMTMLATDMSLVGATPQVAVGPTSLVVVRGSDVAVLSGDGTVAFVEVPGGALMVQPRGDTGDFVVTGPPPSDGDIEQRWILHPNGALAEAPAAIRDTEFWEHAFLPSGTLVLNRPGGVYAVADDGTAERISSGVLRGTGARGYIVEACDTTLACYFESTAEATGQTVTWEVDLSAVGGGAVAGTRLSPDGAALLYFDYSDDDGQRRRMVDLFTGESVDAGPIDQLVWSESWATDSSGIFVKQDGQLQFIGRLGRGTTVFDLGERVVSVATRPPPSD